MTFSQANLNEVLIVFTGVLLLFRRVAQMEQHHMLRVFALTAILSCFLLYAFGALVKPTAYDEVMRLGDQY
jgi:hypothetical protein